MYGGGGALYERTEEHPSEDAGADGDDRFDGGDALVNGRATVVWAGAVGRGSLVSVDMSVNDEANADILRRPLDGGKHELLY